MSNSSEVLIIADEVMTGFGRTGKLFACEYLRQQPDIICLSKGITGGTMALGATSCKEEIYNAFLSNDRARTFFHEHSYTANPVACSAGIASLELLLKEDCQNNIYRISNQHQRFSQKISQLSVIKNVRSTGTILAFDFETSDETSYFNSIRDQLYNFFLSEGIILRPLGNTIYVMPPYCITDKDLGYVYAVIEKRIAGF